MQGFYRKKVKKSTYFPHKHPFSPSSRSRFLLFLKSSPTYVIFHFPFSIFNSPSLVNQLFSFYFEAAGRSFDHFTSVNSNFFSRPSVSQKPIYLYETPSILSRYYLCTFSFRRLYIFVNLSHSVLCSQRFGPFFKIVCVGGGILPCVGLTRIPTLVRLAQ